MISFLPCLQTPFFSCFNAYHELIWLKFFYAMFNTYIATHLGSMKSFKLLGPFFFVDYIYMKHFVPWIMTSFMH